MRKSVIIRCFLLLTAAGVIAWTMCYRFNLTSEVTSKDLANTVIQSGTTQVFEPVLPSIPVKVPQDFRFHNEYQHEWWHFLLTSETRMASYTASNGAIFELQWMTEKV